MHTAALPKSWSSSRNVSDGHAGFTARPRRQQRLHNPELAAAAAAAAAAPHLRAAARRSCAAAATPRERPASEQQAQQAQQALLMAEQQLWSEIEAAAVQADELEQKGQQEAAIELLQQALERLQEQHGPSFSLTVLRQMLWDALYSAERHSDALVAAAQVHVAVEERFGAGSAELHLVSVRLGISSAACGKTEAGLKLIYDAAPVLQHNLGQLVEQAKQMEAAGEADEQAAATLQENLDKLSAALAEANFWGSVITVRHAAATDRAAGVVEGWQELQAIMVSGFCSLLTSSGGARGSAVANALRDHDKLAYDMGAEPLLARLVKSQNEWLHDIADRGMKHPVFQQILLAQMRDL